mmetsp:Transcript_32988/g.79530  ORF Transcript_32988/g.79530 Transcript_32988/m.79530 type:complete len:92 (-) Transcript_32988:38-313(-)
MPTGAADTDGRQQNNTADKAIDHNMVNPVQFDSNQPNVFALTLSAIRLAEVKNKRAPMHAAKHPRTMVDYFASNSALPSPSGHPLQLEMAR